MVLLASESKKLNKSDSAPVFTLPATDGKTYPLKEIKGKAATLIIFMCNHCPYVLPKINEIKRIAQDYKNKGLIVIGINSNEDKNYPEDSFEKMKEYYKLWGIDFYYLRDESQEAAKDYGAVCTPDPFLFGKNLKLAFHSRIDDTHGQESGRHEMHEAIAEFLKKSNISLLERPSMGCSIKWKVAED